MNNCGSGVSSIIVGDSGVVCDGWSFNCADSFCSSASDLLFGFRTPTIQRCRQLLGSVFYVGTSIYSHLHTNVSNALSWVVYSVYVTIFFNVACHFIFLCFEGDV